MNRALHFDEFADAPRIARRGEPTAALIPEPGQALRGPWQPGADLRTTFATIAAAQRAAEPFVSELLPSPRQP